jgi:hypothetical protein
LSSRAKPLLDSYDALGNKEAANMLRRIVSLGQQASESDESMSPLPGDATQSPETKTSGGLASVFKGLTGSKLSKAPPAVLPPPSSLSPTGLSTDQIDVAQLDPRGLPPNHMESFEKLKSGSLNERITAAESLRHAIADYPLNPVGSLHRRAGWALADDGCNRFSISGTLRKTSSSPTR